jgi:hypothetical protein
MEKGGAALPRIGPANWQAEQCGRGTAGRTEMTCFRVQFDICTFQSAI